MSKEKKHEDQFEHIEDALTRGEQFVENNQKMLINAVIVILVIIGAFLGYHKLRKPPVRYSEPRTILKKILSIWH